MDYVLVNDDCDDCRYVSMAFTLLRLPLKKITMENLLSDDISEPIAVIACKNIESQHATSIHNCIDENNIPFVSFKEQRLTNQSNTTPFLFLKSNFSKYELKNVLTHCINHKNNISDLIDFRYPIFEKLIGKSAQISKIKSMIKQVAYSDTTVLILGQSGTGKDVIASCIHHLSNRKDHPFVPINCGAIPSELMESELFGHEKGAFTGALSRRSGRFEIADKGTLFLDEIGDMPLPMQVKLLRVIQDRKIERVGSTSSIEVDVRLIAATNKNLEELIKEQRFREDLFYRLNVFPIQVPTLTERRDDIPLLIDHHLDKINDRLKHRVVFTEQATNILCEYAWPGNVRELQNFLERMVILFPDRVVDEKDIDTTYKQKKITVPTTTALEHESNFNIKEYMAKIEQQVIDTALKRANGAISIAAEYLSLSRTSLLEKLKKYNLMALQEK